MNKLVSININYISIGNVNVSDASTYKCVSPDDGFFTNIIVLKIIEKKSTHISKVNLKNKITADINTPSEKTLNNLLPMFYYLKTYILLTFRKMHNNDNKSFTYVV